MNHISSISFIALTSVVLAASLVGCSQKPDSVPTETVTTSVTVTATATETVLPSTEPADETSSSSVATPIDAGSKSELPATTDNGPCPGTPLASVKNIDGNWDGGSYTLKGQVIPEGRAVGTRPETGGSVTETLAVGGCSSLSGMFFVDDTSTPAAQGQLTIIDPNEQKVIWTSNKLLPGQSQPLDGISIKDHTQIDIKFSCLGETAYKYCIMAIDNGLVTA